VTRAGRILLLLAVGAVVLALPAAASAHAYLIRTFPAASVTLNSPPPDVALTFDEAVEPRFAIISVTDTGAHSVTAGPVHRSPANPNTLVVQLEKVGEGWYLVVWRVISVDGHPVEGAFTFAVGPNPGPAPQFKIPRISATATTTPLLVSRWIVFLAVMTAVGLFILRLLIARPLVQRVEGTSLRPVSLAFGVAAGLGLIAIPAYLDIATASDSLRSAFDLGTLVPLYRTTAFGRGYVDLELCFALFVVAAGLALWLDRPERRQRSVAGILAAAGALVAAAAVLVIPGLTGHAGQTAPQKLSILLDWLHLVSGSIWLGGLLGLLVLWATLAAARRVAGLMVVVPRFSNVAFVSVLVLLGSGTWATVLHMPLLRALWETNYGKVILVKIGLLIVAMALAAVNLLRNEPRLVAARERAELGAPAARLLRTMVGGEAVIVAGAVFAASLLSSLPPPPPAFAAEASALVHVGPGRVSTVVSSSGYKLQVLVSPNRAAAPNSFALRLTKNGKPVTGADVRLSFEMLDMQMPNQLFQLSETKPGIYARSTPALVMVGHWGLGFTVTPKGGTPFSALIVDHATG
jgi:copper transport protein